MAGQRAVESAEMAMLGVTASEDALETAIETLGPAAADDVDVDGMARLGNEWHTTRNIIKAHPSQIYTQAAAQASIELYRRGVRPEGVRKITLYGHRNVASGVQGSAEAYRPANRESADHSTPYVMSMALIRGKLTPREFEGAPWTHPNVQALMDKVHLVLDPARDSAFLKKGVLGVRVEAQLKDGQTQVVEIHQPKGHPDAPFSQEDLKRKIEWLVEDVAPPGTANRLIDIATACQQRTTWQTLIQASKVS